MSLAKKKEDVFFTLFKDYANLLLEMSTEFDRFFEIFPDVGNLPVTMKEYESKGDSKKHTIINELNDSFVTPFDREDIFAMADQLDDLADFMEDIVSKFCAYNLSVIRDDAKELARLISDEVRQTAVLFNALPEFKKNMEVKDAIISINNTEDMGDVIFRNAISKLFHNDTDPVEIIKWKDLYELLEATLDSGENLADTVEGILTKNA